MRKKDMYLPNLLLGFGISFLAATVVVAIAPFLTTIWRIVVCILFLGLGISAILCWKNQWIRILNEKEFEYSTMFGNKTIFQFSQITDIRRNLDSCTLFVDGRKVHIEFCAIVSDAFMEHLDPVLADKFPSA